MGNTTNRPVEELDREEVTGVHRSNRPSFGLPLIPPSGTELDWEGYFMRLATAVAAKSKDPKCRVGAVICSPDNVVISTGFNGFARGVFDDPSTLIDGDEKLKWICHAETNAIANAARGGAGLRGAHIYVTKFPCLACLNMIIQAGLARVCTHDHEFWDGDEADSDGAIKTRVIHQTRLEVVAPWHPAFKGRRGDRVFER